ncbi:MAG: VWA domain-containing protein [Victivallaceae bacterium]|nr:VWA domain-containing protein [Victivallaceae bacterium]
MSDYANENLDVTNPAPRCPVVLLLDVSGSMGGRPIRELEEGVKQFLDETSNDETASVSVEVEIITFANDAEVAVPFCPVTQAAANPPTFTASGCTSLGAAIALADDELRNRRNMYKKNGISSYRPWIVLMTDGGPNDEWKEPAASMKSVAETGKLQYIGIGIGDDADFTTLAEIVPEHPGPVKLKGLRFKEFFRWLTDSLRSVSAGSVADQDKAQLGTVDSWADLSGTP